MENLAFHEKFEVRRIAPYMLHSNFMTEGFCKYLIEALDHLNDWTPYEDDELYSTHDIDFERKELLEARAGIRYAIYQRLKPFVEEAFGTQLTDIRGMFAIKYTLDTQTKLDLHRDDSFITFSIKLNDDYEGADLEFPDQQITNKNIGVGDILIFPGSITHPHRCTELTKGEKYSLTIWTKYPDLGDYNGQDTSSDCDGRSGGADSSSE